MQHHSVCCMLHRCLTHLRVLQRFSGASSCSKFLYIIVKSGAILGCAAELICELRQ